MYEILIVIHALVTLSLIVIILMQRSSADGTGLSGSGSNNSLMSGRTAASFVTRTTSVLATIFILLSLGIGVLTAHNTNGNGSIIDRIENRKPAPATEPPKRVEEPVKNSVPRPE